MFHSLVFGVFFVLNLILAYKGSSAAIPFSTLVALLALWFLVSVPLTFVGAFFGFRKRVGALTLFSSIHLVVYNYGFKGNGVTTSNIHAFGSSR